MVNSNPETVSTDYDTSSRLYFEPLVARGRAGGVPRRAAGRRDRAARRPDARCGSRACCRRRASPSSAPRPTRSTWPRTGGSSPRSSPSSRSPRRRTARRARWRRRARSRRAIGYPVVVRPSYVLGGRAMEIVYDDDELETFVRTAAEASPDHPVLVDRFLEGAIEVDVDAVRRRARRRLHRRGDGAHRGGRRALGRLVCQIPPATLSDDELDAIEDITRRLARRLGVVGLAEPAARREGRADLGARGEPARLAHRAVRLEGDRGLARADRDAGADGPHARRARRPRASCRPTRTTTGTCRTRA